MSSRLQSLLDARLALRDAQSVQENDAAYEFAAPPNLGFPHRLFVPTGYEPRYAYPLVVWLHSDGSSEYELDSVMESMSVRNYVAVSPRAHRMTKHNSRLFRWGTNIADLAIAEDFVIDSVNEVSESLSIAPDRVFVAGFGTGGSVAQWLSLRHPHRFAGGISINGPFPKIKRALSHWKMAKDVPVLFMQGSDSGSCAVEETVGAMKMAHAAGLNYRFVRFETEEVRDESTSYAMGLPSGSLDVEMLRAADRFMMGIVTGTEIPIAPEQPSSSVAVTLFSEN